MTGMAPGGSNAGQVPLLSPLQNPVPGHVSNIPPRKSKGVKHSDLDAPPGATTSNVPSP